MAAFQISGIIHHIGNTESIPYQDKVFRKREVVLDCSYRNQFTGEIERSNYPCFEFAGNSTDDLDKYNTGDIVTVSFVFNGRRTEKDGQVRYFTNIQAFRIERYQTRYNNRQQGGNQGTQANNGLQTTAPQRSHGNAPQTDASNFPPEVDGQGSLIPNGNKEDLPF